MAFDGTGYVILLINNHKSSIQDYFEEYLVEKELNLTATLDGKVAYTVADFVIIATSTNVYSTKSVEV